MVSILSPGVDNKGHLPALTQTVSHLGVSVLDHAPVEHAMLIVLQPQVSQGKGVPVGAPGGGVPLEAHGEAQAGHGGPLLPAG